MFLLLDSIYLLFLPFCHGRISESKRQGNVVSRNLERVKRSRIRYWIHKYLQQHVGENFSALILYGMKKKYRILLKDFLLWAELKREKGQNFSGGEQIQVKIKKVDPRNDLLKVEYAGVG